MTEAARFIVTGCTGLVGHGICSYLLQRGHNILGISRSKLVSQHPQLEVARVDVSEPSARQLLSKLISQHPNTVVIHSAALIPNSARKPTWHDYMTANVEATRLLLSSAIEGQSNPHFIYLSSTSFCRDTSAITERSPCCPENDYQTSKLMGELLCEQFSNQHKLSTMTMRIRAPYGYVGVAESVAAKFMDRAFRSENLELTGSGARLQTFTFVEDIGSACELAGINRSGGVFNVAGKELVSMKELAHAILTAIPESKSTILYSGYDSDDSITRLPVSIQRAKLELGYEPNTDILTGTKTIAQWRREGRGYHFFKQE